ncbi:fungal-specific transcription factor domain-containing protein [Aspergillus tamarii]|uniref:Fungal-specific transcription factor domain-containing protein n=1 Tax=Aspergillus tamarii TaxID=41984 RepID=A0A5N6UPX6_ASPTM|nr:fungal-specific transcription factor domain-containing protein [Aspergillus tamarii]
MNMSTESSILAPTTAVDYLRNCWNVFGELSLSCRDLMAVQALLAMVKSHSVDLNFGSGLINPFQALTSEILLDKEATYIALGAAARVATSLGLQQQLKDPRLSPPEVSERYIIFWCIYSLDKSLSLRLGRPPAIDDRDIEIDIPDERQLTVTKPGTAVLLLAHMRLSRIASEVYSELYSARSRRYPPLKRFRTISDLDAKLQEWCRSLPVDVQPGKPIVCSKENFRHAITLHLEYFNCLATLHRCWAFQDQLTEYDELRNDMARQDCADIGDRVYTGHMICLDSARNVARLLIAIDEYGFPKRTMLVG